MELNKSDFITDCIFIDLLKQLGIEGKLENITKVTLGVATAELEKCYGCGEAESECTCEDTVDVYDDNDESYELSKEEVY